MGLEFGSYGAEGLSNLWGSVSKEKALRNKVINMIRQPAEVSSKVWQKAREFVNSPQDTVTFTDKFGRQITKGKNGYKKVMDKDGYLVSERKAFYPDRPIRPDEDGAPVLDYIIYRPYPNGDYTAMGVRVTPNGFEGRDLTEGIGINNSYDRFENFVKQKMYEME